MKKQTRADRQFTFLKWLLKIKNKYVKDKKQMSAAYNKIK